jgi:hypothetical protein
VATNNISNRLNKVLGVLNDTTVTQEAYKKFVDVTPVRTGNAKRKTRKTGNSIDANYPYAGVLDKGRHMTPKGMRGSDQAPEGMTKPTIDHIRSYVKQKLGIILK